MESLALMVSIIVAISMIGGPLSLIFAILRGRNKRKYLKKHLVTLRIYAVLVFVFGVPAIVIGIRLATLDIGIGGRLVGLIGIATGLASIVKTLKKN